MSQSTHLPEVGCTTRAVGTPPRHPPPTWSTLGPHLYSRPLHPYEFRWANRCLNNDGRYDVCIGFSFKGIAMQNLHKVLVDGLIRLRCKAPVIAADIVKLYAYPDRLYWVYKAIENIDEARDWAERTLTTHENAPSDEDFVAACSERRLPYETGSSRKQYFGCHLLIREDGTTGLFMHGTHAILDIRGGLSLFHRLFEAIVHGGEASLDMDSLLGTDVANLPPDLVHVIGEPFRKASERMGVVYTKMIKGSKTGIGLLPQRDSITSTGRTIRVQRYMSLRTSRAILSRLKAHGLSLTFLGEAALVLALVSWNSPLPEDSDVLLDLSAVSLDRFFRPEYKPLDYIISTMSSVPLCTPVQHLLRFSRKQKLLDIMHRFRAQYAAYIAQPGLAFAEMVGMPGRPFDLNPYAPFITNLGDMERMVPSRWVGKERVLEVGAMAQGQRFLDVTRPGVHVWTSGGRIGWQIQAVDIYDRSYLTAFLEEMVGCAMGILDDDVHARL